MKRDFKMIQRLTFRLFRFESLQTRINMTLPKHYWIVHWLLKSANIIIEGLNQKAIMSTPCKDPYLKNIDSAPSRKVESPIAKLLAKRW
jgi:hypothetical protein